MRCPRCGNENVAGNRFCGMCGATLLAPTPAPPQPAHQPPRSAPATTPVAPQEPIHHPAPEPPRPAARVEDQSPSIAGPSFLGLNQPPSEHRRAGFEPNPSSRSSNLDYLLDDDVEEPKGGGAGKVFLILLALVLAVGFGYLRFKNQGFPWVKKENKPAPTVEAPPASDTSANTSPATTAPPGGSPSITPEPQSAPSQPATSAPPSQPASQPAPPSPDSGETQPNSNTSPAPAAKPSEAAPAGDAASSKPAEAAQNSDGAANANKSENKDDAKNSTDSAAPANPDADAPAAKPHAAIRPADSLAEAQRYLYGRGVPQDCDRGLRLLKPMASQKNPKAMIEMGALYSAGLCTPHDLPTAYYWFALASRKDPSNESINADLQKLWGEMTQPERQLAIKLTQ